MNILRNILATAILLTVSFSAQAQLNLNIFAADSALIIFDTKHIKADKMTENDKPVTFTYGFRNTGIRKVKINNIVTTCSCLNAYCDKEVVSPGETAEISVRFNPDGHPGKYDRNIYVYTKTDDSPAAVLTLSVDVENGMDLSGRYPINMGDIRLTASVVKFHKGVAGTATLRFVNVSGGSLKFDCDRALLPDCLRFYAEPVRPLKEGVIKISYDPVKGMERDEMMVVLQGVNTTPSKSSIKVILE